MGESENVEALPSIDNDAPLLDACETTRQATPKDADRGHRMGRFIRTDDDEDSGMLGAGLRVPTLVSAPRGTRYGTASSAMTRAQRIKTALMDWGVHRVRSPFTGKTGGVSIELQQGHGPDPWDNGAFIGTLNHHTAGPSLTASRVTPSLSVVKNGRSDLQGPLCNGYGGGDFFYRIICCSYANHPGLGGPMTLAKKTIPLNNGRPYLWGTEWDWDGISRWPEEYLEWMARCNGGLLQAMGRPIDAQAEHKDWAPKRKIDRNDITRAGAIDLTRRVQDQGEEQDVTPDEMRAVLGLKPGQNFAVAAGQPSNFNVLRMLVGYAQANVNFQNTVKSVLSSLAASTAATLKSVQDTLAAVQESNGVTGDDEVNITNNLSAMETRLQGDLDHISALLEELPPLPSSQEAEVRSGTGEPAVLVTE